MRRRIVILLSILCLLAISISAFGQSSATSSLNGSVFDPTGAVITGAQVTIKNNSTNAEFRTVSTGNGTFSIPAIDTGTYTVSVSASGFKVAVLNEVKIDAGVPATVRVSLEIGNANESVVIQGGGEMLQTQTANITTTLNVNQIANLPLVSRNPLNFLTLLPGVNSAGINRDSTINGLPQSAIDITLDGINIQDNFNKTGDGFFTRVPPSIDSVQEVTVSTATPEAMGGAMGATSIKFITRSGTNDYHGSLYWYHRNPSLNSANWFTNRNTTPVNSQGRRCDGIEAPYVASECNALRARVLINQFGGRLGGPINIPKLFKGEDKAFFFVNYEEFRQPNQVTRTRTIFSPEAQQGIFRWTVSGVTRERNLYTLAASQTVPMTSTPDPVIGKLLTDIRSATTGTGGITALADPNLQRFTYSPSGFSTTKRPTVRLDFNLTQNHHLEASWTYHKGRGGPDFLNNVEPKFPGFPNQGSQPADRYTGALALRSTLSPTLVNEARAGLSGGPSRFNPGASGGDFINQAVADQMGFNLGGATGNNSTGIANAAGIDGATATTAPSRRNPLLRDFSDTLTWTKGAHSLSFGGKFTRVSLTFNQQTLVPTVNFGVAADDPANAMFNSTNFPGASDAVLTRARGIYAALTGRITSINANARLNEETGEYVFLGNAFERSTQNEYGFFAQDSWRARPNLTLNFGVRWEVQGPFTTQNDSYTTATVEDLWGVSGPGNLFKPGTMTGRPTQFIQYTAGTGAYKTDYTNFAPSFGFAWSPGASNGWLKRVLGEGGQTVVRGGYSMAYNRQGIGDFRGTFGANPGVTITTNRDLVSGTLVANTKTDLPLLFRDPASLARPAFPNKPAYPLTGAPFVAITNSVNIFDPNIEVPYSQSWIFGIQREITKNMTIEVRYVGTRNLRGWTDYDLNDVEQNILENGMLDEFRFAQANLRANIAAGRRECPVARIPNSSGTLVCPQSLASTFQYYGPGTGTSPLPITLAHFGRGIVDPNNPAHYRDVTLFTSSTFINPLAMFNSNPITFASNLHNDAGRRANALANDGKYENFFLTNPGLRGGAFFTGNGGYNRYDGLQIELRRRLSRGLLVEANYQFAKSFSSERVSFRAPRINALNGEILRHALKFNWAYELPFGRSRAFFGNSGHLVDRLIGGWEFYGSARIQSGSQFNFGNVTLVGMTMKELQDVYKLRFEDNGVFHLPDDIIVNTKKAFATSATSLTGYGSDGPPSGKYIAPANRPDCIEVYDGQCAPQNVFVTGPKFTRFDLSVVKKVRIKEGINFELRGEFLNAFNHVNFLNLTGNGANLTNPAFGEGLSAYTDASNTQDPGGRLVQIVARFTF